MLAPYRFLRSFDEATFINLRYFVMVRLTILMLKRFSMRSKRSIIGKRFTFIFVFDLLINEILYLRRGELFGRYRIGEKRFERENALFSTQCICLKWLADNWTLQRRVHRQGAPY